MDLNFTVCTGACPLVPLSLFNTPFACAAALRAHVELRPVPGIKDFSSFLLQIQSETKDAFAD